MRGVRLLPVLTAGLLVVACSAQTTSTTLLTGTLNVHVNVSGTSVDTIFTATFDGTSSYTVTTGQDASFQVNDSTHTVTLGGVADNCEIQSTNPQTIQVDAGATGTVTFDVTCTTNGVVAVTTATTGPNQDDQYTLAFNTDYYRVPVGPQQTLTISLPVGTYSLELTDVAANCAVQGTNPVSVDLVQDSVVAVSFQVACTSP
jgi:hypothetical protein